MSSFLNPSLKNGEKLLGLLKVTNAVNKEKILEITEKWYLDVNIKDSEDNTPLHYACEKGLIDIVSSLIKNKLSAGLDPTIKNKKGLNPVHVACLHNHTDIVKSLLTSFNGTNSKIILSPNDLTGKGTSLLMIACMESNKDLATELIDHLNADVNIKNMYGFTALHNACLNGLEDIVGKIAEKANDLNPLTENDVTPIYFASERGYSEIVELLLTNGESRGLPIDVNKKPKKGPVEGKDEQYQPLTPLEAAKFFSNEIQTKRTDLEINREKSDYNKTIRLLRDAKAVEEVVPSGLGWGKLFAGKRRTKRNRRRLHKNTKKNGKFSSTKKSKRFRK
jgi:hypothetical protein